MDVMDCPSSLTLVSLPLEIFQYITSFLEPSDLTCLGLSCSGLWSLVAQSTVQAFAQKNAYWLQQRAELLLNLARDSADMMHCEICMKLQPLHYGRTLTVSNQWIKPPCSHLASHVSMCTHFSVTLEMLELVLKLWDKLGLDGCDLNGSNWVSSPDPLGHTCTWRTSGSGSAEFALRVTSKVFERNLYVKLVYDVDIKLDTRRRFSVPSMRGKACPHSGLWLKKKCACALEHAMRGDVPCAGCLKVQRCAYCFTHVLVSANRASRSGLHLQVTAYRYLGGGQAGGDSSKYVWMAQTLPVSSEDRLDNDISLEDIFERSTLKHLPPRVEVSRKRANSFSAAYIAFHEKFWRPPPWHWN